QIKWIKIPVDTDDEGSRARVSNSSAWGEGVYREGRVIRLLNALEEEGRMARLLVQIDDPLSLTRLSEGFPRMILGEYVRVEIEGVEMESVAELSRSLFRDGDVLWVRDGEGRLEVRPAEILFRGQDHLYVAGNLEPGEEVVATDLSSPVAGMPLRTADSEESR
ncbi:MAG: efflux transporter periplasmic adaptor subunit, partial [Verrucomicrobia bacterium]|nr:efflux transporter periplasmic adaptor subunit [Verrucomicrobiota bacterium]